jgi:hypothetical protein
MNTRYDNHASFAHGDRSHPVSLLSAAVATADKALIGALAVREDIQLCAFHKWEAAGRPSGDGVQFWLEAEKELSEARTDKSVDRDGRSLDHSIETPAAQENAKALDASVDNWGRGNSQDADRHRGVKHPHSLKL